MWITLSDTVTTLDFKENHENVVALEQILASAFRGDHIVFGSRSTLTSLLSIDLSISSKSVLRGLLSKYAELATLESDQYFKVIVDASIDEVLKISSNEWKVPLGHFSTIALGPSCILGENLRDARAFVSCSKQAIFLLRKRGVKVKLCIDSGGGADTPNKLAHLTASRQQFVMVVTDTDRTYPEGGICAPTKSCEIIVRAAKWVAFHEILDASEIENVLPVNLVNDSIENSPSFPQLENRLNFLKGNAFENEGKHKWMDLKNGVKYWRLRPGNKNTQERKFWINNFPNPSNMFNVLPDCNLVENCPHDTSSACVCNALPGLGEDTLDRFNRYCDSISLPKQCERVKTSQNAAYWISLGSRIASWGTALEKQRS